MPKIKEFEHFGVLLDMSRNAVMRVSEVKKFIDCLQKMNYNCLQLYTEDTYEIVGEPYFGYMRGRYTGAEIKELDSYAKERGIELIPCVQTLAHFPCLVRHAVYQPFVDTGDILLVDDERTYALIDKIFATLAENFSSRLVNIGMDEAHMVGLGQYLDKHGYVDRYEILLRHLNRVVEIADKYGFKPHMWSDMFFRLACKAYYDDDSPDPARHWPAGVPELAGRGYYVDKTLDFEEKMLADIPEKIELVYWDYYNVEKKFYDAMFASHAKFNRKIWFGGGAWCWNGFAPHNRYSLQTMKLAMEGVKEHGVKDVFITLWGDDGKECSYFSVLPSLYAIRRFADGVTDMQEIADGFEALFGVKFSDFMLLDIPNGEEILTGANGYEFPQNPCKSLLFNDPFLGVMDKAVQTEKPLDYGNFAIRLKEAGERAGEWSYIFNTLSSLCSVLELKADLGVWTRVAYQKGDKAALTEIVKDYQETETRLAAFYEKFSHLWHKENKPFGFEVQEIRLGGIATRLRSCRGKLEKYLQGKLEIIEELEETVLGEDPEWHFYCNRYQRLATFGVLSD